MEQGYPISRALVRHVSDAELRELCNGGCVDLGWWTRFYSIEELSQEEQRALFERDVQDLKEGWRTDLSTVRRADLLSVYADGFYQASLELARSFIQKPLYSDREALPILFLSCQFLELALKASIEHMVFLREQLGRPVVELDLNTHDLCHLLEKLGELFEPNEPFLSEETQAFIRKIAAINEMAQAFRYPFSSRRNRPDQVFLTEAPIIPMKVFEAEFAIHGQEMNLFHMWLCDGYIY
jgi:hypothetical protein